MAWCTYPMNETLMHQQLSLHQLHYCHLSQWLTKWFFRLRDVTFNIRIKSLRVMSALPCFGLPRIAVPFERHLYSWLFIRNCSSGEGLCKCVTLFQDLSVICVVQLYPQGRSQTSVCQSRIAKHAFTCFILACYARRVLPWIAVPFERRVFRGYVTGFTLLRSHKTELYGFLLQVNFQHKSACCG